MIGWNPRPFIFVHIPKCAGESVENALIPIVSHDKGFKHLSNEERNKFWLPGKKWLQHRKLWRYEQCFGLDGYFKFAFVRNPWDRAISQIEYLRTKMRATIFANKTYKDQIQVYCSIKRNIWGHDLGACQSDYLLDSSGKMKIDFVGRFESLQVDFKDICYILGMNHPPELPHLNNLKRNLHYSQYYDDESSDWIRKRFAKDIDYFNFKFEKPIAT